MEIKRCVDCEYYLFKENIGMDYCNRPDGYKLLTMIERSFVEERDLPKNYTLCGTDGIYYKLKYK